MMRVRELLDDATRALLAVSESPRLDAELLLAHVLGCGRSTLRVRDDEMPAAPLTDAFQALLQRRLDGEPVAYLTGQKEFWSLALRVGPEVLVPRADTETLVEQALALIPAERDVSILDLGTGSGAIALALASERRQARITAADRSAAALAMARDNAAALGLSRVRFVQGDWFAAVPGERFEVIVCNPPYVAGGDPHLASLRAEPLVALSPGPSGLEAYRAIIPAARTHLRTDGWILFEHGAGQAQDVKNLLECNGFDDVTSHPDTSGTLRVTQGRLSSHMQRQP